MSIIILLILQSIVFLTPPTKAEVENFFKYDRTFSVNDCNPYAIETDENDEHLCAYKLRRQTALVFGQVINAGFPLFAYTPFGYFNYELGNGDFHIYVLVVTRDEGPLVYSPVNGDFIGNYNNLMQEMGCEVQSYEKSFFPIQPQKNRLEMEMFRCLSEIRTQQLDALKSNSTGK